MKVKVMLEGSEALDRFAHTFWMIQIHIGPARTGQRPASVINCRSACMSEPSTSAMLLLLDRQWLDAKNHLSSMKVLNAKTSARTRFINFLQTFNLRRKTNLSVSINKPELFLESRPLEQSPAQDSRNWQPLSNVVALRWEPAQLLWLLSTTSRHSQLSKISLRAITTLQRLYFIKLHLMSVPDVSDTADYSWCDYDMSSRTRSSSYYVKQLQCSGTREEHPPSKYERRSRNAAGGEH